MKHNIINQNRCRLVLTKIYVKDAGGWNWQGVETSVEDEIKRKTKSQDISAVFGAMTIG